MYTSTASSTLTSVSNMLPTTNTQNNETEFPVTVSPTAISQPCIIDPQLAFIVAVSAGGLILVLLISNFVLTCKIISLKRQCQARRHTRSNVDLVSGTGYWGTERMEGGIVGPCETNLLLEEVRTDAEQEEAEEEQRRQEMEEEQEEEEEKERVHRRSEETVRYQSATANMYMENNQAAMQISPSRDSCIDVKELEDMPLVV